MSTGAPYPDPYLLLLFAIGAIAMRAAGCIYNDIVDRDIDAQVMRTRSRPLPSGQVTTAAAVVFMLALCAVGLAVLLSLNSFSVLLGLGVIPIVALYPFVKRISYWPQAVLGLAFNWGALVGWAAVLGSLGAAPALLYAGAVAWTIGYDTIYAHQDREDDELIGMKSTALRFGASTKAWLTIFYGVAWLAMVGCRPARGGRHRVRHRHELRGRAARLASGDARYRRCGQLSGALPLEPRFRGDRFCRSRGRHDACIIGLEGRFTGVEKARGLEKQEGPGAMLRGPW